MNFYLDLGDKRFYYLKNFLENKNLNILEFNNDNIKNIKSEDVIILSPAHKITREEVELLPNCVTFFAGNISNDVNNVLKEKSINYINIMLDEPFVLKNAELTAQGVLCELLNYTKLSLYKMDILILGGGRVAKALGTLFQKLNLNYNFTTINNEELSNNIEFQKNCIEWGNFKSKLKNYNIIINTIPALIFSESDEEKFLNNCFVFEVASVKCLKNINTKNFNYILSPALPSKYTANSAGEIILEVVEKHIKI